MSIVYKCQTLRKAFLVMLYVVDVIFWSMIFSLLLERRMVYIFSVGRVVQRGQNDHYQYDNDGKTF